MNSDQKQLQKFIKRRHPDYAGKLPHWNFLESTYYGGREWFAENIFRYLKEGEKEFHDRVQRAYRFNHTRESVNLVQKYIFKADIRRNEEDAPAQVSRFWEKATLSGLDINQFMKALDIGLSIFGRVLVVVDSTKSSDVVTLADEEASGARVYAYFVRPQDVLDMAFDEDGSIRWVLVRETVRDDDDPIEGSGEVQERFRLWTKDHWYLFAVEKRGKGRSREEQVVLKDEGEVAIGRVPAFFADDLIHDGKYSAPSLINDIAYLDRAVANYLSNLDAIIQDQTFSQLAMPAQAMLSGDDAHDALIQMGTKRIFTYDGEGGARPEYLSPDPKQAQMVLEVINKIISEIYHTIGMAGERTKQDNAVGIDNSSGVAKAYDFERLNSLLVAKAQNLEDAENKLVELVCLWHLASQPADKLVAYADNFDIRGLNDEFAIAERLALIEAPDSARREQMKQLIDKLFPQLTRELKKTILEDLESWPSEPEPEPPAERPEPPFAGAGDDIPFENDNRQGEVTADTE